MIVKARYASKNPDPPYLGGTLAGRYGGVQRPQKRFTVGLTGFSEAREHLADVRDFQREGGR